MSSITRTRRFQVVGQPFYRIDGKRYADYDLCEGQIVTLAAGPDEDGDVTADFYVDGKRYSEALAPECLVEIDDDGYAVVPETPEVDDEAVARVLVALGEDLDPDDARTLVRTVRGVEYALSGAASL